MRTHYYYLSAFRLLAALFVLIGHARCEVFATYTELNTESQTLFTQMFFAGIGWTSEAMAIFFILSGFLVGGTQLQRLSLALKCQDAEKECKILFRVFAVGRFTRIILPLAFAILLAAMAKMIGGVDFSWWDALLNLFGLQGVLATDFGGVYWSIAYEVWFYVLIAGIISLFCGRNRMVIGFMLILLSAFVFIKLSSSWFFLFLLGIGLYFVKDLGFPRICLWIGIAGVVIVKMLGVLSIESHVFRFALHGQMNNGMLQFALAMSLGMIMTMFVSHAPVGVIAKSVEKIGNSWSVFTYGLYITHFTVLELFRHLFGQMHDVNGVTMLIFVLMCVLCSLFGYLFYWVIEFKLGDYIKKKLA